MGTALLRYTLILEQGHGGGPEGDEYRPGAGVLHDDAGSNNSTKFPDGSSSKICRPPGPATMSLRSKRSFLGAFPQTAALM